MGHVAVKSLWLRRSCSLLWGGVEGEHPLNPSPLRFCCGSHPPLYLTSLAILLISRWRSYLDLKCDPTYISMEILLGSRWGI